MRYQEHQGIGTIDDISAALSAIRESVQILAARWRVEFTANDTDELERILDAADRIQAYHLVIRSQWSAEAKHQQGR